MMYVEFMKKFSLADSSELMAIRLISASWAQKRLIPTVYFLDDVCRASFERADGFRLISASWAQKGLIPTV